DDGFAFPEILTGIAATVIAFDDFLWNDLEVFRVVIDRATKFRLSRPRAGSVAFSDFGFSVDGAHSFRGLEKNLKPQDDFIELVGTKGGMVLAEIRPGMDVVGENLDVIAVDVVVHATGDRPD